MGNVSNFCRNETLLANETSYEKLSECWTEKRLADFLRICLPLIILPTSLISNLLSFIALRTRQMRGTTTAFFMLTLSVLDPLLLITKNLLYFPTFLTSYASACKCLYFLIYVLGYTNVWILVIMTVDKFLAVWFPLKASYLFNITRAKYVCIIFLFLSSIISFHHFWTIKSHQNPQNLNQFFCFYDMNYYTSIQRLWRLTDFIIWCFLPFILIFTLSILIIYKLGQKRTYSQKHILQRKSIKTDDEPQFRLSKCHSIVVRSNQRSEVIRSRHRHITLMLLAVAIVFLCLTFPNSIYFVLEITYNFNEPPQENDAFQWLRYLRLKIIGIIMFQISDLQHATNFFLYLLTSHKFRRSIVYQLPFLSIFQCDQSRRQLPTDQYQNSIRSSVSDVSAMLQNSRKKSLPDRDNRLDYRYQTITTDFS